MQYAAKAIFSGISLADRENRISRHYNEAVSGLIDLPEVQMLDLNSQHLKTSRLQHSINVSFYSFRLARLLRADTRAAARAGLLHDMYYYDFKDAQLSISEHSHLHSELALENAQKVTKVSPLEEDIILAHMWPLTGKAPNSIEGYIVSFVDKYCTLLEVASKIWPGKQS